MKNLITVILNDDGTVKEQSPQRIFAYANQQTVLRVYAPYAETETAFILFQFANGLSPEKLMMSQLGSIAYEGVVYSGWDFTIEGSITDKLSRVSTSRTFDLDVQYEFLTFDNPLFIGVVMYEEDLPETAEEGQIVRVIVRDVEEGSSDFVWTTDEWVDSDDIVLANVTARRNTVVTYGVEKGISTGAPTHKPDNTELIITELNKKASLLFVADTYVRKDLDYTVITDLLDTDEIYIGRTDEARVITRDNFLKTHLALIGGTMEGDIDMATENILNIGNVYAVQGFFVDIMMQGGDIDLDGGDIENVGTITAETVMLGSDNLATKLNEKVDKTRTIVGLNLQSDITKQALMTAIGNATDEADGFLSKEDYTAIHTLIDLLDNEEDFVDTLEEIIAIFAQYPEELNLIEELDKKIEGVKVNDTLLSIVDKVVNVPLAVATGEGQKDGVISHETKAKIDGIEVGANVNVQSDWSQEDDGEDDFIKNKPTVEEGAQVNVQSDWNQADSDEDDFIKNKPTIPVISTDIETDNADDTKTTSPKAVYTFVNNKVANVYKPAGSLSASGIVVGLLIAGNLGNVYNITEEFTIDSNFKEYDSEVTMTYPIGTNIVVVDIGDSVYKFDVLAGWIDLSDYVLQSEVDSIVAQAVTDTKADVLANGLSVDHLIIGGVYKLSKEGEDFVIDEVGE